MEGFSVELSEDAVIAYPGPGYPYEPVDRVIDLVEESEWMCGFGSTVFKSIANEVICLEVIDGMEFEYVYPPEVLAATVTRSQAVDDREDAVDWLEQRFAAYAGLIRVMQQRGMNPIEGRGVNGRALATRYGA